MDDIYDGGDEEEEEEEEEEEFEEEEFEEVVEGCTRGWGWRYGWKGREEGCGTMAE